MAYEIATINFDDLELHTALGWRIWTSYRGQFEIDNSGDICAIRVLMMRPGRKNWSLEAVVPEDGQIWEDLVRSLKAEYGGQITEAFEDWYHARPATHADKRRDMAVA